MLPKVQKNNFRILPLFIFFAVLTLSIKINNIFDTFKNPDSPLVSIAATNASAEDSSIKETQELTRVLERADNTSGTDLSVSKAQIFSQTEISILQELAERREALDLKAKEIDKRAVQLKVAEEEIDKKVKQLQEYENKLRKLIADYNVKEKAKLDSLVKLYSTMKPKDAARIFNTLDMDILVSLVKNMKPSVSSAILSQMKAEKAKAVTAELIGNNY